MSETFSIEIPVSVTDNTGTGVRSATLKLTGLEQAAKKTANTQIGLMAKVDDRATSALKSIDSVATTLGKKSISLTVKVLDLATGPLRALGSLMTSTLGMLGLGAGGYGLFQAAIATPISQANTYTQSLLAFQRMMGNAQGSQYVKQLQQYAIATPYQQQAVLAWGRNLVGTGMDPTRATHMLATLGDTASFFNVGQPGAETLVTAVSRMQAEKRLDGGTLDMFTQFGIPIWDILQKITGNKNQLALRAQVGAGVLTSDQYLPKIEKELDARYGGSMNGLMNNSLGGLWAQIRDQFNVNGSQGFGMGIQTALIPALQKVNDWLTTNQPLVEKWSKALTEAGTTLGGAVVNGVTDLGRALLGLVNSPEWSEATTLGDKAKLVWQKIIADPFSAWWSTSGRNWAIGAAGTLGTTLGSALGGVLAAALQIDPAQTADAGTSIGNSFAKGFLKGFNEGMGDFFTLPPIGKDSVVGRLFPSLVPQAVPDGSVGSAVPLWNTVGPGTGNAGGGVPDGSIGTPSFNRPAQGYSLLNGNAAHDALVQDALQAANASGVNPEIFLRQIQQESQFDPNARSKVGAIGLGQFMPGTAMRMRNPFDSSKGFDPTDPHQALWAAAQLDAANLHTYGGDYAKALTAYNAGPGAVGQPLSSETRTYLSTILGNAGGQQGPGLISNQFDFGPGGSGALSAADAAAACGPTAALAFARATGRNPTITEAIALARKVGWNNQSGMAGPNSEVALLSSMGVASSFHPGAGAADVAASLSSGLPVMVSTPNHYFVADQFDPNRGFHVGGSGLAMRGGSAWETWAQMVRQGGGVNGDITLDQQQRGGGGGPTRTAAGATIVFGPGSIVVHAPGALDAKAVNAWAEVVADPIANVLARRLGQATANAP